MAMTMLLSTVSVFAMNSGGNPYAGYVEVGSQEVKECLNNGGSMSPFIIFNGEYETLRTTLAFINANTDDYGFYLFCNGSPLYVYEGNLYWKGQIFEIANAPDGGFQVNILYNDVVEKLAKEEVDKSSINTNQIWYYEGGYLYTDVTEEKTTATLSGFFSLFARFAPRKYVVTTRYYLAYDKDNDMVTVSTLPVDTVTLLRTASDEDITAIYHECKVSVDVRKTASISSFLSWLMGGTRGNVNTDEYTMTITVDMDKTIPYSVSYRVMGTGSSNFDYDGKYSEALKLYEQGIYDDDDMAEIFASYYTFTDYYGVASFTKSTTADFPPILIKINYVDEEGDNCSLQIAQYDSELGCYVVTIWNPILF